MKVDTYLRLKSFFMQTFFASFLIYILYVFAIGIPILTNQYSVRDINLDFAGMKITGKYATLTIEGESEVFSGSCYISLGELCQKYRYKSLYSKNSQIVVLEDKYAIVLYSDIIDSDRNEILINNLSRRDEIIKKFVDGEKFIPNILLFISFVSLMVFFVARLMINSKR